MNIIESAYLKSKRQKSKDQTNKDQSKDQTNKDQSKDQTHLESSPKETEVETSVSDLVVTSNQERTSSREQISKMKQSRVYTPKDMLDRRLIYTGMQDTMLLNIYRNLRTKLLSSSNNNNFLTLVTSVTSGGGSSLVTANLASTFAFDEGKTAVLIDANIHKPSLSDLLGIKPEDKGLIDFLEVDNMDCANIIYETPIPRLRLIPNGITRENSAEYFTSKNMKRFVEHLISRYPDRYPIIDAPSITYSADTRILTELCDRVILVVPYGQCTEEEIKIAARAIGKEKLAGVVLNKF